MQDHIKGELDVQEAYVDDMDVPTVILHGETNIGPTTIHLKSTNLEMTGVIIGEPYAVDIVVGGSSNDGEKKGDAFRSTYEAMWDRDTPDGGAARA